MAYKPLTLREETYNRLKNFKERKGWTFNRAIEHLLDELGEKEKHDNKPSSDSAHRPEPVPDPENIQR